MSKVLTIGIISTLLVFLFPLSSYAHPGDVDIHKCHTCETNCSDYGVVLGEYHCHGEINYHYLCDEATDDPDSPASLGDRKYKQCIRNAPEAVSHLVNSTESNDSTVDYWRRKLKIVIEKITSLDQYLDRMEQNTNNESLQNSEDGYGHDFYDYSNNENVTQDITPVQKRTCPSNSHKFGSKCRCDQGYFYYSKQKKCVPATEYCKERYGEHIRYDEDKNNCSCKKGYSFSSDQQQCVNEDLTCKQKLGENSFYNHNTNNCECRAGHSYNSYAEQCVNSDLSCKEKQGENSFYSQKEKRCKCEPGYALRSGECISHTADCRMEFGSNIRGEPDGKGASLCYCQDGYKWNDSHTQCVKTEPQINKKILLDTVHQNSDRDGESTYSDRNEKKEVEDSSGLPPSFLDRVKNLFSFVFNLI